MLARLFLALLLAAFALPALANGPCHDTMPAVSHHAGHGGSRPDERATIAHVCIGCIPPASLTSHPVAAPLAVLTVPHRRTVSPFAFRAGTPPALPPPRRDA